MRLTPEEKETIILWDETENDATIMTYDKHCIAAIKEYTKTNPACKLKKHPQAGISTTVRKQDIEIKFNNHKDL